MNPLLLLTLALPAPAQTPEVSWTDVRMLAFEGQGWDEVTSPFDRLPAKAEGVVRGPVWSLSRDSAGMCARFVTDATELHCRWSLIDPSLEMAHMPATGVSGVDLYVRDDKGVWRWLACPRPNSQKMNAKLISGIDPGTREYMLYLPLYNGVTSCEVGVPEGASLKPGPKRSKKHALPIVFYGTSITHGGCASRPGMPHPAILGRRLERPIINLGFSGNGRMDLELADLLGELEASVFIIDCLPNMNGEAVSKRVVPFVQKLRASRPDTPILLVEDRSFSSAFLLSAKRRHHTASRAALRAGFDELKGAGVERLHYLEGSQLLGNEDTVDGSHPTDLGFVRQAGVFEAALRDIFSEQAARTDSAEASPNTDPHVGETMTGADTEVARRLAEGLKWLADHQSEDGSWSAHKFMDLDPESDKCDGAGEESNDIGVTGLALLALMGDGSTMGEGEYGEEVAKGIAWLLEMEFERDGIPWGVFWSENGGGITSGAYGQGIATLAVCEACKHTKDDSIWEVAQRAVDRIQSARNPYGAWRYGYSDGDNDTSVTGWMVSALLRAKDVGLKVDPKAFVGALGWLNEVTEEDTGRVGYDDTGTASSRMTDNNEHYPTEFTECLTAIGLMARFELGQTPEESEMMTKHAELIMKSLPQAHPDGLTNDLYYWYHGSRAMKRMGGVYQRRWSAELKSALLETQSREGSERGSWDPIGPWGQSGGRVYSTALGALCLEVSYR